MIQLEITVRDLWWGFGVLFPQCRVGVVASDGEVSQREREEGGRKAYKLITFNVQLPKITVVMSKETVHVANSTL